MGAPSLLADEMVGRLARYLRFVGCDTVYARGLTDDQIRELARREGRTIVTRDRELARRADSAVLLSTVRIADQWRELRAALPEIPTEVRFDRCSVCNGSLRPHRAVADEPRPAGVPWGRVDAGLALFRCTECGHVYWEGGHTAHIRTRLRAWGGGREE